ncbi:CD209 antigen-like protein E isoform X3 [Ostrinia furnacalis]|uniref:Immulectin-5 n=1 Tax=Ostrinia furnacalis TaxID=93504 RepID=A0A096ZGV1_OSTFU|nr:CD209 antigen-like protein E isoform X3 [Ostrinia furnacalis]AIR96001.1 immulectin-5 [Ostrinia furnacalis]
MLRYKLFTSILFVSMVTISHSQRDNKYFRKDYTYIEATDSFYKMHTIHKTWENAKDLCAMEGATLFYPENQEEADAVSLYWNATQPFPHIFIGASSLIAKGIFETVDGQLISDVYSNWAPGEPNDSSGNEDCVSMNKDQTLNDLSCEHKSPFVCKKTLDSLDWNTKCDIPYLDYEFDETLGKCYKFYSEPRTWRDAYVACSAELSYLAIIDSQAEADHLAKITTDAPKEDSQNALEDTVFLGFNKLRKGWKTIKGTKLQNSGYTKWGDQQPDGGDSESCGGMSYDGLLKDAKCEDQSYFICEHDVATSYNLHERFGD